MRIHSFPFDKVKKNTNVVIYGVGEIGRSFYEQLEARNYLNVLCFLDRNIHLNTFAGIKVINNAVELKLYPYDFILIASLQFKNEMIQNLLSVGIDRNKIIAFDEEDVFCFESAPSSRILPVGSKIQYGADGLWTVHNFNFSKNEKFTNAYDNLNLSIDFRWRVYNACWAATYAARLEGDFVECGVCTAMFSRTIARYLDFEKQNRTFYLFDTFSGTVESQLADDEKHKLYQYDNTIYEKTVEDFKAYPNVKIIKGEVPSVLNTVEINKICYLSLDMNCSYPEIEALKFYWDKIVNGGVIFMDDYAYTGYEAQMRGFDNFFAEKGVDILNLPCGQGMAIKL